LARAIGTHRQRKLDPALCRRDVAAGMEQSGSSWGAPLASALVGRAARRAAWRGFVTGVPSGVLAWFAARHCVAATDRDIDRLYGAFAHLEDPGFFDRDGWRSELMSRRRHAEAESWRAALTEDTSIAPFMRFFFLWLTRLAAGKAGRPAAMPFVSGLAGAIAGYITLKSAARGAVVHYEQLAAPTSWATSGRHHPSPARKPGTAVAPEPW
jgi:hypothetical protein